MKIRPLGSRIGVEVRGIDVRSLDDGDFGRLYQAWLAHNVLVVRDQQLEVGDFLNYSVRFGGVTPHPSKSTRHPECPEITVLGIDKFGADGKLNESVYRRGGFEWHTDGAYDEVPFKATQLYALAIPSRGGDTLFADAYAAHDALPARLRERLAGRQGAFVYGGRTRNNDLLEPQDRDEPPALHPILRRHPETGRVALYFDPGKILRIEGLDAAESDDIIDELTERMVLPDAQYRHVWSVGDVVIWDNRCSYHLAAADYPPEEDRIHWRVSITESA